MKRQKHTEQYSTYCAVRTMENKTYSGIYNALRNILGVLMNVLARSGVRGQGSRSGAKTLEFFILYLQSDLLMLTPLSYSEH